MLEADELLEAAKASVAILQCDQRIGDVVYIPPRSWYQVCYLQRFCGIPFIDERQGDLCPESYKPKNLVCLPFECHNNKGFAERFFQVSSVSGVIEQALVSECCCV